MRALTWSRSDGEKYLGPLTWSPREPKSDRLFGLHVTSDKDEGQGAYFRFSLVGATLLCRVPAWLIRPCREMHYLTSLSEAALAEHVARTGRDWYWDIHPREYGFEFHKDTLHWSFGVQKDSWTRGERKTSGCWFYPWTRRRTVRQDYYDLDGVFYSHIPSIKDWDAWLESKKLVPAKRFAFKDYDGEVIVATLRLEERETAMGEGRWRWLSRFFPNQTWRSFDIEFSSEVGTEKGTWKGGTVGHSISSDDRAELHEAAFQRYCAERTAEVAERGGRDSKRAARMTFLHEV